MSSVQDIRSVPPDLEIPEISTGLPGPGKRVSLALKEYEGTGIHHLLYLPTDWKRGARYPVIVEYAGNGPYHDHFDDVSDGTVEGSRLGYGVSAGKGFIWICMPYVNLVERKNQAEWWGDVDATAEYCRKTVNVACDEYGGDSSALAIAGFSRGAIACNFIGLHDDKIARLWKAFIAFSHYDGVRENWGYAGADRASALVRLKRLKGRPQFICNEGDSCTATEEYIRSTGIKGDFTFQPTFFRNHNDAWVLRDSETRRNLRKWLGNIVKA
ncbi:MAG TPA: hypothetical protein DET40_06105 [Lentisphaeria bacterium]|nr:MAG: hypothetical protein A2X45_23255 [Lentisphaerae bacterium GWF2_50_93]HCE43100.1 hypothetical protein [Lentisphaeria bacterium]